jgi:hypothetical protein
VHRARASLDDPVPHASRARRRRRASTAARARDGRATRDAASIATRRRRRAREAVSTRGAVTAASNDVTAFVVTGARARARRRGGEAPKIEVGEATHRDASRRIATRGGR